MFKAWPLDKGVSNQ